MAFGSALSKAVREPLLHFALVGIAVFALFNLRNDGAPVLEGDARRIEVSQDQIDRLAREFEAVWRRATTEAESDGLIVRHIRQEVLYREALALGLDRDDAVIRQRLQQKMEFLSEVGPGTLEPTEEELRNHYAAYPARFATPTTVSFEQVKLDGADPVVALAALNAGEDRDLFGPGALLPPRAFRASQPAVDGTFGRGFFAALESLPIGEWTGPVTSAYGQHLIRMTDYTQGHIPPLEEIGDAVAADWRLRRAEELKESFFASIRDRYEIVVASPGEGS